MELPSTDIEQAELLVTARRYDDALRILARMPEDGAASYLSAVAYLCKGNLRAALQEAERTIALMPEAPEPHALRADVLHGMGRNKASLEAGREAVRLAPDQAMFQYTLARSALAVRDWKLAEAAAQETLRLAPEWADAHNIVALVARGRGRKEETQAHLRQALEIDPNNAWVINNLAVTMPRLKPRTETVRLLEEAVRLDPSQTVLVENLWAESTVHVQGGGFDRLDIFLGGPTLVMAALAVVVLLGWIPVPHLVSIAVVAVAVPLVVVYAVGDFVRNRARLRNLRTGTRAMYLRRFYRGRRMAVLFFLLTMLVPLSVLGAVATSMGAPLVLTAGVILAAGMVWIGVAPLIWHTRVQPWLTKGK